MNDPGRGGLSKQMKVSEALAAIIGKETASRAECIKLLWKYVKKHKLIDPKNKQFFEPDKTMEPVFGKGKMRAFGMAKFLGAHLSPL